MIDHDDDVDDVDDHDGGDDVDDVDGDDHDGDSSANRSPHLASPLGMQSIAYVCWRRRLG